jgi:hypothetical protein
MAAYIMMGCLLILLVFLNCTRYKSYKLVIELPNELSIAQMISTRGSSGNVRVADDQVLLE